MSSTFKRGRVAENFAKQYFCNQGYMHIASNFYSRYGEIDLIFRDKDKIVFVEVKSLELNSGYQITETLSRGKLMKLAKTIEIWLQENSYQDSYWQIDFLGLIRHNGIYCVHHISNL